jgi:GGDEF domain-containing protein
VQSFVAITPRSTVAKDKERQQFLYFQAETSAREITNDVESVRQRIEAATFQYGESPIRTTLSCSVAEALYEEEPSRVVQRLEEMLREAQRYGRNRTFFQEGEQSAPAIPPNIAVENRVIEI